MEGAILAMARTMMTARVRRTRRAVSKAPGKGREHRMGKGKGKGKGKGNSKWKNIVE